MHETKHQAIKRALELIDNSAKQIKTLSIEEPINAGSIRRFAAIIAGATTVIDLFITEMDEEK